MKGNKTLFLFEGIACILVVLIHDPFPGDFGVFFVSIARYAVPLFFMVSGYSMYAYLGRDIYREKIKSRLKRNIKVLIISIACYFLFDIAKCLLKGKSVFLHFAEMITIPNVLRLVFLGVFPPQSSCGILWFMLAQIYIYVFILLFTSGKKKIIVPYISIISFFVLLIASSLKIIATAYHWKLGPVDLSSSWIYGNWILMGLPCFLLGIGIADYIEKNRRKISIVPISRYLLVIGVCIVLNYILCLVLDHQLKMYLSYTVFTLVIDYCAFAISQQDCISGNNLLAKIGCYHSRNIYIAHPAIISGFNIIFEKYKISGWGGYIHPLLVIITTLVFSMILNAIGRWINTTKAGRAQ